MIFYGSNSKLISSEATTEKCSHCGTQNCIEMSIFQKYAHIYWLPLFPLSKYGVSECNHCKQVLEDKDFDDNLKSVYTQLKSNSSTPIWTFIGAILILILIAYFMYSSKTQEDENSKFIQEPKIGDIYDIRLQDTTFTIYKVVEITKDTVLYTPSNYETNTIPGLKDLKEQKDDPYSADIYYLTKSDLKSMLDKNELIDITRK